MRLRAEYLFQTDQRIRFQDVNGKTLAYSGGSSRKDFELYLRNLYGVASTYSLSREMKTRRLSDMQSGDVFVYPAREIHVMCNFENPFRSPRFMLNEDADNLILSVFHFKATDLKHF